MSEYGNGLTFHQTCEYDRDRIEHALIGELMCGETKDDFAYAKADKKECDEFILSAYDNAVHQAEQSFHSGRALEKIIRDNGIKLSLEMYMKALQETEM